MFEIKISASVKEFLESYYLEKLEAPNHPWDLFSFESQVIGMQESLSEVFHDLKNNPYCYPEVIQDTRFVSTVYLPYILFYRIEHDIIHVIECRKRTELF